MSDSAQDILGFTWMNANLPRHVPVHDQKLVCFHFAKMLPEFVWDASYLEGNPFTFAEVQTLLDGITVGGHRVSDQEQVLNLAESSKFLLNIVKQRQFSLNKDLFTKIQSLVAKNEALEWGVFRGEGAEKHYSPYVALGELGRYDPVSTAHGAAGELDRIFHAGVEYLRNEVQHSLERALLFFLFGALQQFFFDGNKRSSRFMMNGELLSHGIHAISIPAKRANEFNQKMARFYLSRNADEMLVFLISCHFEADLFR